MNYRHAFHAGNFADVIKHAVLTRILVHLLGKPAAFRVIDTHAGAGVYDLTGDEASRSGEWRGGIGRLLAAPIAPAVRALLKPYLDVVASFNSASLRSAPTAALSSAYAATRPDHSNQDDLNQNAQSLDSGLHANDQLASASTGTEYVLTGYPGSPALARAFLRAQDRLVACELEP